MSVLYHFLHINLATRIGACSAFTAFAILSNYYFVFIKLTSVPVKASFAFAPLEAGRRMYDRLRELRSTDEIPCLHFYKCIKRYYLVEEEDGSGSATILAALVIAPSSPLQNPSHAQYWPET